MKWLISSLLLLASICPAYAVHVVSNELGINIKTDKSIFLSGVIEEPTVKGIKKQLAKVKDLGGPLIVLINSPGGSIHAGGEIVDELQAVQKTGTKLICINLQDASSMAFNTQSFCDIRLAVHNSRSNIHKGYYSYLPFIAQQKLNEKTLRQMADALKHDDERFCEQNAKMLKMTRKEYDDFADLDELWPVEALYERGYLQGFAEVTP